MATPVIQKKDAKWYLENALPTELTVAVVDAEYEEEEEEKE